MTEQIQHAMGVQSGGMFPSLAQRTCTPCGYVGPVRDLNDRRDRIMFDVDRNEHLEPSESTE
ncbi:MAG: hypothetical protein KF727_14410 [Microbacteriaceae bacterium]|nr:hypothetical protein [Microbacteriaceae bacterium]